jgi:hypothetical protein
MLPPTDRGQRGREPEQEPQHPRQTRDLGEPGPVTRRKAELEDLTYPGQQEQPGDGVAGHHLDPQRRVLTDAEHQSADTDDGNYAERPSHPSQENSKQEYGDPQHRQPDLIEVPPVPFEFSLIPLTWRNSNDPSTACAPSCAITPPCRRMRQPRSSESSTNATRPISTAASSESGCWVKPTLGRLNPRCGDVYQQRKRRMTGLSSAPTAESRCRPASVRARRRPSQWVDPRRGGRTHAR